MIVSDVVTAVRNRLGDSKEERWLTETLVLYTAMCQNDICILTNYNRQEYQMTLYEGQFIYNLPSDCTKVERLEYNDEFFPIETRNSIDDKKAKYPCALKDNIPYGKIEIRLEEGGESLKIALDDAFGVVSENEHCVLEDGFGVVSSIDTDGINPNPDEKNIVGYLKVYYSAVPALVTNVTDELLLPDMWISAFIHFVCGMALQDDNDANNIQRGEMEAQKYQRMLQQLFIHSAKDFTSNYKSKLTTSIRRV